MSHTSHIHEREIKRPRYGLRRAGAAGALALAGLGIFGAAKSVESVAQHHTYVNHPEKIPDDKVQTVMVLPNDTADSLAKRFSGPDHDYGDLSVEIQNQAKDGLLQPGQVVRMEDRLVHIQPNEPH